MDNNIAESIMAREERLAETVSEIRGKFPEVEFPSPVKEPIFYGRFDKNIVENKKLILDKNTGYQYDVVSDKYVLVRHEEVVKSVLDSIPEEFGEPSTSVKLIMDGARCIVETKFPELGNFKVNGSPISPMTRVINSINRSTHLTYLFGAMEQVCTNGLIAFVEKEKSKFKHIIGSLDKAAISGCMRENMENFSIQHNIWNDWAQIKMNSEEILEVSGIVGLSEKESEKLLEIPLLNHNNETLANHVRKGNATMWGVNSAITQFAQTVKSAKRALDLEQKIGSELHKRM